MISKSKDFIKPQKQTVQYIIIKSILVKYAISIRVTVDCKL